MTARWLRPPFDLDGWRVDVANMAGRLGDIDVNRDAAVAMRATMAETKPDAYLVAEHAYDASRDLDGDGWHGVMNYLAFTRPAWCWLRRDEDLKFLGDPLPVPRFGGRRDGRVDPRAAGRAAVALDACRASTCSGRTTRPASAPCAARADRQIAGAGLLFTFPGVPMVFAGDEIGLTGVDGDGARQPMPWDAAAGTATCSAPTAQLAELRRSSPALRHGGLRWVHADDDVLVYLRESRDERLLVQVSRADHAPVAVAPRRSTASRASAASGTVTPTSALRPSCCPPAAPACTCGS